MQKKKNRGKLKKKRNKKGESWKKMKKCKKKKKEKGMHCGLQSTVILGVGKQ
jgi:hypothetical protein